MEAYANALLIAIPLFLLLILIEIGYGIGEKKPPMVYWTPYLASVLVSQIF